VFVPWTIFLGGEDAAGNRLRAERREDVRLHLRGAHAQRIAAAGQVERRRAERRDVLERSGLLLVIDEFALRDPGLGPVGPMTPQQHHPIGLLIRQGT
jgi:hypothetical protein